MEEKTLTNEEALKEAFDKAIKSLSNLIAIYDTSKAIYRTNKLQGFWDASRNDLYFRITKIALIGTEVSEMIEAVRKGDIENEGEEAADIFIRLLDYCGAIGIDLYDEVKKKLVTNSKRPFRHGKRC